jgi:hypothetical protein
VTIKDPDRLVAICRTCDRQKTPRDMREIARSKRLALWPFNCVAGGVPP